MVRLGEDQYVEWSNTVDAPVSPVLPRHEMIAFLDREHPISYLEAAHALELADQHGTNDPSTDLAEVLATNRAGDNEQALTLDEILRMYRK